MVEWGGHHGGWGGFGPPSYIVKKCPVNGAVTRMATSTAITRANLKHFQTVILDCGYASSNCVRRQMVGKRMKC